MKNVEKLSTVTSKHALDELSKQYYPKEFYSILQSYLDQLNNEVEMDIERRDFRLAAWKLEQAVLIEDYLLQLEKSLQRVTSL